MKIFLAADHGGYKLKEEIKNWLNDWNIEFEDFGAFKFQDGDDYPDFAWPAGVKVGATPGSLGVFVCRSGQGVCMVANKARHVRAALCWNEKAAISARNDDDANVLCLPSDHIGVDAAKKIVQAFLHTPFGQDERFARRVIKVKKIDQNL